MTIGIYNQYLDTLGGGERYCFDIASCLAGEHEVHIFWDNPDILDSARSRFKMSLSGVQLVKNIWKSGNVFERANITRKYDAIFFVSDGSIPFVFSKKVFVIFQFPTDWVQERDLMTRLKVRRVTNFLCYSQFVKERLDKKFGINATVLAPAVDLASFSPKTKEKLIVSVGRFTTGMNTKKQGVLIDAFKKLSPSLPGWRLVLAGGVLPGDESFVEVLKKQAKGYPIEILPNISHEELVSYYGRAKVYWHAAGFGEDTQSHPERAEHFGLTTIEAMASGAVPVVFSGGGQKEVVGNWVSGFHWDTQKQLTEITQKILSDAKMWVRISKAARERAYMFGYDRFCAQLHKLIV